MGVGAGEAPGKGGDGAPRREGEGEEAVAEGGGQSDERLEAQVLDLGDPPGGVLAGGVEEAEEGGEEGIEVPLPQGLEREGAGGGRVDEEEEGALLRGWVLGPEEGQELGEELFWCGCGLALYGGGGGWVGVRGCDTHGTY